MFANSIEAKALEHLQIVDHCFFVRWQIQTIGPKTLVQSSDEEGEFAV